MNEAMSADTRAQIDILLCFYSDIRAHSRHAETLRSNAVNYILVITSALVAIILSDRKVERSELPLCVSVIVVGVFGLIFVTSYTELYQRNKTRSEHLRRSLNIRFFRNERSTISNILLDADRVHRASSTYRWGRRITGTSHRFWLFLPSVVVAVGIALSIIAV